MQLPPYDHQRQRWDFYKAFHRVDGNFVFFADGSAIYTDPQPDPSARHKRISLNIEIKSTADSDCPALFAPGEKGPIPKTHLTVGGGQYLMIDHDFDMAVRLMSCSKYGYGRSPAPRPAELAAPGWLTGRFACYWGGPHRKPVGGAIAVSRPMKPTPEQAQKLKDLQASVDMWASMHDLSKGTYINTYQIGDAAVRMRDDMHTLRDVLDKTITDFNASQRLRIWRDGWESSRVVQEYEYLSTKPLTK